MAQHYKTLFIKNAKTKITPSLLVSQFITTYVSIAKNIAILADYVSAILNNFLQYRTTKPAHDLAKSKSSTPKKLHLMLR